ITELTDPLLEKSMTRSLMSTAGAYLDVGAIGEALLDYSEEANYAALDALTDYLSPAQVTDFAATPYVGRALSNITSHDTPSVDDDATIKSAVRNLMQKLGSAADAQSIADAMTFFSAGKNFGALDAVTDYLTPEQKTELGLGTSVGETLLNIVNNNEFFSLDDDAAITDAIRNLMTKLGAQCDIDSLGLAMQTIPDGFFDPFPPNLEAFNVLLNRLSPEQVEALGETFYPDQTLYNLINTDVGFLDDDDTPLANAADNLMQKFGEQMDAYTIVDGLSFSEGKDNYAVFNAVLKHLSDQKAAEINAILPGISDEILYSLSRGSYGESTGDYFLVPNTIHNWMEKMGDYVFGHGISLILGEGARGDLRIMDAATDYLTDQQLSTFAAEGTFYTHFTIQTIVQYMTYNGLDGIIGANAARDLMSKMSGAFDEYAFYEDEVIYSVGEFALFAGENAAFGIDAVLGELSTELLSNRIFTEIQSSDPELNLLLMAGVTLGTTGIDTFNGADPVNDKYIALAGNDTLRGYGGDDELYGDSGKDVLYGGLDNDLLHGGADKDKIYGEDGDDIIFGGKGADELYGGSGADTFWFDANDKGTGVDVIKDFSALDGDKIDISDVLERYNPATDDLSGFVRLTVSGSDTLVQADLTGPGVAGGFSTFAKIEGVTGLDTSILITEHTTIV
ncbi:MAG: calcium-binding protein, partial [Alphaproteobacteria bacterium]